AEAVLRVVVDVEPAVDEPPRPPHRRVDLHLGDGGALRDRGEVAQVGGGAALHVGPVELPRDRPPVVELRLGEPGGALGLQDAGLAHPEVRGELRDRAALGHEPRQLRPIDLGPAPRHLTAHAPAAGASPPAHLPPAPAERAFRARRLAAARRPRSPPHRRLTTKTANFPDVIPVLPDSRVFYDRLVTLPLP